MVRSTTAWRATCSANWFRGMVTSEHRVMLLPSTGIHGTKLVWPSARRRDLLSKRPPGSSSCQSVKACGSSCENSTLKGPDSEVLVTDRAYHNRFYPKNVEAIAENYRTEKKIRVSHSQTAANCLSSRSPHASCSRRLLIRRTTRNHWPGLHSWRQCRRVALSDKLTASGVAVQMLPCATSPNLRLPTWNPPGSQNQLAICFCSQPVIPTPVNSEQPMPSPTYAAWRLSCRFN